MQALSDVVITQDNDFTRFITALLKNEPALARLYFLARKPSKGQLSHWYLHPWVTFK